MPTSFWITARLIARRLLAVDDRGDVAGRDAEHAREADVEREPPGVGGRLAAASRPSRPAGRRRRSRRRRRRRSCPRARCRCGRGSRRAAPGSGSSARRWPSPARRSAGPVSTCRYQRRNATIAEQHEGEHAEHADAAGQLRRQRQAALERRLDHGRESGLSPPVVYARRRRRRRGSSGSAGTSQRRTIANRRESRSASSARRSRRCRGPAAG